MKERKKYSKEFKLDAVSLVLEQEYTRREAANSLGINAQMLGRWVKEHQVEDGQAFQEFRVRVDKEFSTSVIGDRPRFGSDRGQTTVLSPILNLR